MNTTSPSASGCTVFAHVLASSGIDTTASMVPLVAVFISSTRPDHVNTPNRYLNKRMRNTDRERYVLLELSNDGKTAYILGYNYQLPTIAEVTDWQKHFVYILLHLYHNW